MYWASIGSSLPSMALYILQAYRPVGADLLKGRPWADLLKGRPWGRLWGRSAERQAVGQVCCGADRGADLDLALLVPSGYEKKAVDPIWLGLLVLLELIHPGDRLLSLPSASHVG